MQEWKRAMDCEMKSMGSNLVWSLDVDVQKWKRAMTHEMGSMDSNSVWSLGEVLKGVKPIGSKLIYKKKSPGKPCVQKIFKV